MNTHEADGTGEEINDLENAPTRSISLPEVGQKIQSPNGNIYTFTDRIGEGYFSLVFGCTDLWNNRLAAKVFKPLGRNFEDVEKSVIDERNKLLFLRHPNITYLFDAFVYDDTFYVITERCGSTLHDLFKIENFDGKVWFYAVARCLLQGLEYIHQNGYAHQDLHFGNVMYSFIQDELIFEKSAMTFKIADFGISKLIEDVSPENTRANWLLPPEALNSTEFGPLDHRIDIYHVGLILLQLAYSAEIQFTREQILNGAPRQLAQDLEPPFSFALEKALRRHVSFRTESAQELWRDINSQTTGLPLLDKAK